MLKLISPIIIASMFYVFTFFIENSYAMDSDSSEDKSLHYKKRDVSTKIKKKGSLRSVKDKKPGKKYYDKLRDMYYYGDGLSEIQDNQKAPRPAKKNKNMVMFDLGGEKPSSGKAKPLKKKERAKKKEKQPATSIQKKKTYPKNIKNGSNKLTNKNR